MTARLHREPSHGAVEVVGERTHHRIVALHERERCCFILGVEAHGLQPSAFRLQPPGQLFRRDIRDGHRLDTLAAQQIERAGGALQPATQYQHLHQRPRYSRFVDGPKTGAKAPEDSGGERVGSTGDEGREDERSRGGEVEFDGPDPTSRGNR